VEEDAINSTSVRVDREESKRSSKYSEISKPESYKEDNYISD
jgi:hypothetical protein